MLEPLIMAYLFVTITGFTITYDIIDSFRKKIDIEGYEIPEVKWDFKEKMMVAGYILKKIVNPITSLGIILGVLTKENDILESIKENLINSLVIVPKNFDKKNMETDCCKINDFEHEERVKLEKACEDDVSKNFNIMSNEEKLASLEKEREFLMDSLENDPEQVKEKINRYIRK